MMAHTPWIYNKPEKGNGYWHIDFASEIEPYGYIATCWKDAEEYARLIAAAPELLEACEALIREHDCEASAFEDSLCECKLCTPARAAIAKARGG